MALIAVGISEEGQREILGLKIALRETAESWKGLLQELRDRGLKQVELATSDAHEGLETALRETFPGCIWNRCQAHFRGNVLDKTPAGYRDRMHELLDQILEADSQQAARQRLEEVSPELSEKATMALEVLSADSIGFFGNRFYLSAFVVRMYTLDDILRTQRFVWFTDGALPMEPLWLDWIQPRAFRRQLAGKNPNPAFSLDPLVVFVDPVLNLVAYVPGRLVPDQSPDIGAPAFESLADPFQKRCRYVGDRAPFNKAKQHVRLRRGRFREINAVAGQCLRGFLIRIRLALDKAERLSRRGPRMHLRLGESTPMAMSYRLRFVEKTQRPSLVLLGESNQAVSLLPLSVYWGSGLRIQSLARCQLWPISRMACRIVSLLTVCSVSPSSKATSANSGRVHVERSFEKSRGLRWASSKSASRSSSSKMRSGSFGPGFSRWRLSVPSSLKPWMALRTVCAVIRPVLRSRARASLGVKGARSGLGGG